MNKKRIIKNLSYVFSTNLITLGLSTILTFIVPKLIGMSEFSYWQLYVFYASYVGIAHLGLPDGVYLLLGGKEYNEVDKEKYGSLFFLFSLFQIIVTLLIFIVYRSFYFDSDKFFVISATLLAMIILNIRNYLLLVLQATNKIKEFSIVSILEKILFVCSLLFFILLKSENYEWLIVFDLFSKLLSTLYAIYLMRDLINLRNTNLVEVFKAKEIFFETVNIGSKLLIANLASMLIIGIIRFGIEINWDIETFGQVSLSLNISNLLMIFINSIGIVVFPIIKKLNKEQMSSYYQLIRENLISVMLIFLVLFFPLKEFLYWWLPEYRSSIVYMGILFPICMYEGKMSLLVNTYMKSLRLEKTLLKVNIYSLVLSIILMYFSIFCLSNLTLAVSSIVIVLAFRSNYSEHVLSKELKIKLNKNLFFETLIVLIFIISNVYLPFGWLIYSFSLIVYIAFNKKNKEMIIRSIDWIKMKKNK